MKTTNQFFVAIILLLVFPFTILAQEEQQQNPEYVTMTTMHWNMEMKDFKKEDWIATEKEFLEKVTNKNEHILSAGFYLHNISADNSELIYVQSFASWNAIDLAAKRNEELIKAAWTDESVRDAYFKKRSAYYVDKHSDEIYGTMPFAKPLTEEVNDKMIVHYRVSHLKYSEDGSEKEFMDTFKEYNDHVTQKNEHIKAYYPMIHSYGSDKRHFAEATFLNSLGDIDKMYEKDDELFNAHWTTEESKKEMGDIASKYFTGWHSDAIYSVVPELRK